MILRSDGLNTNFTLQSYRGKQKFFNSLSVEEVAGGPGEGGQVPPSSDGSLKVNKCSKQPNRWSGLWGGSNKVGERGERPDLSSYVGGSESFSEKNSFICSLNQPILCEI